jgi:hypothetical protein
LGTSNSTGFLSLGRENSNRSSPLIELKGKANHPSPEFTSERILTSRTSNVERLLHRVNMLSSVASSLLRSGAAPRFAVGRVAASQPQRTWFSSDSHGDFAPKRKAVEGEDEALKIIKVRRAFSFVVMLKAAVLTSLETCYVV